MPYSTKRALGRIVALVALAGPVVPCAAGELALDEAQRHVYEAHRNLLTAYASLDIDALAGLMDPGEELLIFHPGGNLEFASLPSVRWGLERMIERVGPSTWTSESDNQIVVGTDLAWHTYKLVMEWSHAPDLVTVRGTEIWKRRAAGWRLVHAHWSDDASNGKRGSGG